MDPHKRIILVLDGFATLQELSLTMRRLAAYVGKFKIGPDIITRQWVSDVRRIAAELGVPIFYDAKFHDIPPTVKSAMEALCELPDISMVTVHCLGGSEMLKAVKTTVQKIYPKNRRPVVLGVTLLTTHDYDALCQLNLIPSSLGEPTSSWKKALIQRRVLDLAKLAKNVGVNGVVASAQDAEIIRKNCGLDFVIVSPGICPDGADPGTQKRTATPAEAIRYGVDYLVIGRAILHPFKGTQVEVVQRIIEEIASVG